MDEIQKLFLSQGIVGGCCIVESFVIWRLFKLYADAQEKRISEGREYGKAVSDNANALEQLSQLIKAKLNV